MSKSKRIRARKQRRLGKLKLAGNGGAQRHDRPTGRTGSVFSKRLASRRPPVAPEAP